MTNPFIIEIVLKEHESVVFLEKCFHKGTCEKNKLICSSKNPDPNTKKAVNYIDQCCCINNPCINSYGFNSDSFKKNHDGKHILFAGCSYTHGSGVTLEELWAYQVYKNISKTEKCSGFFNIGFPGTSIQEQAFMIMKYIEKFGDPEIIFWLMPPTSRGFSNFTFNNLIEMDSSSTHNSNLDNKLNSMYIEMTKKEHKSNYIDINEMTNYMSYVHIYNYCKSKNIKLYSFTWQVEKKENSKSIFFDFTKIKQYKTFYSWEKEELIQFCEKFSKEYKGNYPEFLQVARDGGHLGIAPHAFWAEFIYEKYKNDNTRN